MEVAVLLLRSREAAVILRWSTLLKYSVETAELPLHSTNCAILEAVILILILSYLVKY